MASRLELHEKLCGLLGSDCVYFRPPESKKMSYPAIRYSGSGYDVKRADDRAYHGVRRYDGVIIDRNPDSNIPNLLLENFQMCSLGKDYMTDNLNHFTFTIYY